MTTVEPLQTRPLNVTRGLPGLVVSLLAVWAISLAIGALSLAAGAVVGILLAAAVLALHGSSWIVPWLRRAGLLASPGTWGVIVLAFAAFAPGRLGPSVLGVSLDDLPTLIGTLLIALDVFMRSGWRRLLHPLAVPIVAFAAWSGVATLVNGDALGAAQSAIRWAIVALLVASVARFVQDRENGTRLVVGAIVAAGFIQALFGLWAYFLDVRVLSTEKAYMLGIEVWRSYQPLSQTTPGRITGTLGVSSNFFGGLMLIPMALSAALFAKAKKPFDGFGYGAAAVTTFFAMVLSYTRASYLAAGLAAVVLVITLRKVRVAVLMGVLLTAALVITPFGTRFSEGNNRLALLDNALSIIQERLFFGVGAGDYTADDSLVDSGNDPSTADDQVLVVTPHNSFLLAAAETGVPGGILLLLSAVIPLGWGFVESFKKRTEQAVLAGLSAGMAAYVVQTASNNMFHIPNVAPVYWLAASCAVGVILALRRTALSSRQSAKSTIPD